MAQRDSNHMYVYYDHGKWANETMYVLLLWSKWNDVYLAMFLNGKREQYGTPTCQIFGEGFLHRI